MTTSAAMRTVSSTGVVSGSRNVTPSSISRSRIRRRRIASAAASSTRVFTPIPSPGSGVQNAATVRPASIAAPTMSVKKISPVAFGRSVPIAPRSQARSMA